MMKHFQRTRTCLGRGGINLVSFDPLLFYVSPSLFNSAAGNILCVSTAALTSDSSWTVNRMDTSVLMTYFLCDPAPHHPCATGLDCLIHWCSDVRSRGGATSQAALAAQNI